MGHSYGGLIITGVADRCADRIRASVYFDAFVPERSEQAIFQNANPERMAAFQRQIDAGAIGLEPDGASITWAEGIRFIVRARYPLLCGGGPAPDKGGPGAEPNTILQ